MGSLTSEIRSLIIKTYKKGYRIKDIADMFDVHRWTVWEWVKRTRHLGRKTLKIVHINHIQDIGKLHH